MKVSFKNILCTTDLSDHSNTAIAYGLALAAPPEDGTLRPIRDVDLEKAEPESHWLPRLRIAAPAG